MKLLIVDKYMNTVEIDTKFKEQAYSELMYDTKPKKNFKKSELNAEIKRFLEEKEEENE
jgi:hypothetical protein